MQMYPSIQAKIWGNIGQVSDLLDMVLDSFIKVCVVTLATFQVDYISLLVGCSGWWLVLRDCNGVDHIDKVKLHRARLVPELVTTSGGSAIPVLIQARTASRKLT